MTPTVPPPNDTATSTNRPRQIINALDYPLEESIADTRRSLVHHSDSLWGAGHFYATREALSALLAAIKVGNIPVSPETLADAKALFEEVKSL